MLQAYWGSYWALEWDGAILSTIMWVEYMGRQSRLDECIQKQWGTVVAQNVSKPGPGIHPGPKPWWWEDIQVPVAHPPQWMAGSELRGDEVVECEHPWTKFENRWWICQVPVLETLELHSNQTFGATELLLGTQGTDSFIPFMHLILEDKRHTFLEKNLKSILTIDKTLFTNEFMQLIKRNDMFPAVEQCLKYAWLRPHQLSTCKPHLCAHGSYLGTDRTSNGMFCKMNNTQVFDLLFHWHTCINRCGCRLIGHLIKHILHPVFEELPILVLVLKIVPQAMSIDKNLIGKTSR